MKKEGARNDALRGTMDEIVKKLYICKFRKRKREELKGAKKQFRNKMEEDVSGNRNSSWKEVTEVSGRKAEYCNRKKK